MGGCVVVSNVFETAINMWNEGPNKGLRGKEGEREDGQGNGRLISETGPAAAFIGRLPTLWQVRDSRTLTALS